MNGRSNPDGGASAVPDERTMYTTLAPWWPLLSAPEDYAEEAALYARLFAEHARGDARSLLELGSGGGNNASHLKRVFASVTLVDRSPAMLDVSRALNPECQHFVGDMFSARLDRTFDCVFLHDAVCYATSRDELRAALETLFVHCREGGVAVVAPDFVRETFRTGTDHGGHDGPGRGLRYLEWTRDPEPTDHTYVVDFAFLLRDGERVTVHQDHHVEGLFSHREWMDTLADVGFEAHAHTHRFSDVDFDAVVFVGVRPGGRER
jgi:SAM-dependent methyltransferase